MYVMIGTRKESHTRTRRPTCTCVPTSSSPPLGNPPHSCPNHRKIQAAAGRRPSVQVAAAIHLQGSRLAAGACTTHQYHVCAVRCSDVKRWDAKVIHSFLVHSRSILGILQLECPERYTIQFYNPERFTTNTRRCWKASIFYGLNVSRKQPFTYQPAYMFLNYPVCWLAAPVACSCCQRATRTPNLVTCTPNWSAQGLPDTLIKYSLNTLQNVTMKATYRLSTRSLAVD